MPHYHRKIEGRGACPSPYQNTFINDMEGNSLRYPNQVVYQGGSNAAFSQSFSSEGRNYSVHPYHISNLYPSEMSPSVLMKRSQSSRSWIANDHARRSMDSFGRTQSAKYVPYHEGRDEFEHIREGTDEFHPPPSLHVSVRGNHLIRNERDDNLLSRQEMLTFANSPRPVSYRVLRDESMSISPSRCISRDLSRGTSTSFRRRVPITSHSDSTDHEYSERSDPFETHPVEVLIRALDYAFVIFNAAFLAACAPLFDDDEGSSKSRKYSFE